MEQRIPLDEWKAQKKEAKDALVLAQREALQQVVSGGDTLTAYLLGRGRLGSHLTSGNAALVLQAIPEAKGVMPQKDWYQFGRAVSKDAADISILTRRNGYLDTATVFDVSQTYGNKPYHTQELAGDPAKLAQAVQALTAFAPVPVLIQGGGPVRYDGDRQAILCPENINAEVLFRQLAAAIVVACMEQHTPGVAENRLTGLYAAGVSLELCGRFGIAPDPEAAVLLENFKSHIAEGNEREELENIRELARPIGDAVATTLPQQQPIRPSVLREMR